MGNLNLNAPAKINLSLNVLPVRGANGYYEVRFVNTQAALSDSIRATFTDTPGVRVEESVVPQQKDLAALAARSMIERHGLDHGVTLNIDKNIPLRAGLGGGSADAAAVINGMAAHTQLGLSAEEKNSIARELGMDVCYCVVGGLCTVSDTGETVARLPFTLPRLSLLIATPTQTKPSTSWAYSILEEEEMGRSMDRYERLLQCIERGDVPGIAGNMHNDFELPMQRRFPIIGEMKDTMKEEGALRTLLAGSGLSVFGIFTDTASMTRAMKKLQGRGHRCFATHTID